MAAVLFVIGSFVSDVPLYKPSMKLINFYKKKSRDLALLRPWRRSEE